MEKIHDTLRALIAKKPASCERVRVVVQLTESVNERCIELREIGFDFEGSASLTAIGTIPIDMIELLNQMSFIKHIKPMIHHYPT